MIINAFTILKRMMLLFRLLYLEELDKFKRGNDLINFHAREFTRELDKLSGDMLAYCQIFRLVRILAICILKQVKDFSEKVSQSFPERTADHRILAIAEYVCSANKDKTVVLITKDINLRMKAKSLGIIAQDYENDKVANIDDLYKGIRILEGVNQESISKLYEIPEGVPSAEFNLEPNLPGHQFFIMKNNGSSALAHYNPVNKTLSRVIKQTTYGIDPRNAEQTFAIEALSNPDIQLVSLTGKAGTGKTLLALAAALQQHKRYKQIFLARPIVPLANRDLGFLPGDVKEKDGPIYAAPV